MTEKEMNKKVEELVEWATKAIDKAITADMVDGRLGSEIYARYILSHKNENGEPDLALICDEKETDYETLTMLRTKLVIPLAEALEKNNG